jgi:hypothetical protein
MVDEMDGPYSPRIPMHAIRFSVAKKVAYRVPSLQPGTCAKHSHRLDDELRVITLKCSSTSVAT